MNRQDGPLQVGGVNENTAVAQVLKLNNAGELLVTAGGSSGGNPAASPTGSAVPADADYQGVNIGGTLRGVTGVNPSGSVFAEQVDLSSVAGTTTATGNGVVSAGVQRVAIASDNTAFSVNATLQAGSAVVGHVITDTTSTTAVTQGTATNLKAQAENYQGGAAVGAANPLQVSLANTGANATAIAVSLATAPTTAVTQSTSPWIVAGGGTAGSAATGVATIQGIASMTPVQVSQATAANLNATVTGSGSAGSAAAGVVTVQGIASMTKLLVTPDANSAVNVAQINGVAPSMGNGASGTGVQRVTLASDSTGIVALTTGSSQIGHLEANQSVNLAQVAGATISQTNPVPTVFPGTLVSGAVTSAMSGTTSTSVIGGTGSNFLYITNVVVSNASTTVSTDIILQDGSGGTTLYTIPAPAASVATTGGGGASVSFPVPLKVPTSGNGLFAANVTTGSSTKISACGFRSTVSY